MRVSSYLLRQMCLTGLCAVQAALAQTDASSTVEMAAMNEQRAIIEQEKKQVLDQFQTASKACWKRFAVNDCLANVRRQKYQDLAPLDQREIQLNARQRELKELERQQRLTDKASTKGNS